MGRNPTRAARRSKKATLERKGICDHKGCKSNAFTDISCITCEKLHAAGKLDVIVTCKFCLRHQEWAMKRMKRHALVAHPANIVRAVARGLAGDDITQ